ncbi:Ropporin-1 like protein [Argiope bruennichi]|uniref:Ropporin-1 like protein n=1 Tax=Argiope bruennichi TaxID=94029 RepID=A0A8T0E2N3_ARGBR|nr:Ropporin-1 like protein [Argiope bruennichi]
MDSISARSDIEVPDELKVILKEYAKNLIKSQPEDLVQWSAEYFRTKVEEEKLKESENFKNTNEEQQ